MRKIEYIVIHCSASKETSNYSFEQLIKDHKKRGFRTCGYHYYIRKDGTRYIGRHMDDVGAHVKGYNHNSIGICYEGGLDYKGRPKDTRTEEQKNEMLYTMLEVLTALKTYQPDVKVKIVGHRDLSPDVDGDGVVEPQEWLKQCPCFEAIPEFKSVKV